jgi:hypothetical protein
MENMDNFKTTHSPAVTQFLMALAMPIEYLDMITDRIMMKIKPMLSTDKEPDELLTIEEAAAFLSTSKEQVYQWVNKSPFYEDGPLA